MEIRIVFNHVGRWGFIPQPRPRNIQFTQRGRFGRKINHRSQPRTVNAATAQPRFDSIPQVKLFPAPFFIFSRTNATMTPSAGGSRCHNQRRKFLFFLPKGLLFSIIALEKWRKKEERPTFCFVYADRSYITDNVIEFRMLRPIFVLFGCRRYDG